MNDDLIKMLHVHSTLLLAQGSKHEAIIMDNAAVKIADLSTQHEDVEVLLAILEGGIRSMTGYLEWAHTSNAHTQIRSTITTMLREISQHRRKYATYEEKLFDQWLNGEQPNGLALRDHFTDEQLDAARMAFMAALKTTETAE